MKNHDYNVLWNGECVTLFGREPLTFEGVAGALGRVPRWNGQSILGVNYTVLHHSYVVYLVLAGGGKANDPALMLALWHDAHEIATADIPRPWKTEDMRVSQRLLDAHFYQYTLRLPFPNDVDQEIVHSADMAVLAAEARVLMPREAQAIFDDEPPDTNAENIVRSIARVPRDVLASMWAGAVEQLLNGQALKTARRRV